MKRFLSILLASMMILGCMAVTVSADVAFALETGDTLAALATNPTVAAGRKVMVTKIAGATYYRNGEAIPAADVVDGPKANTVALPVIEGGNVFQVAVGGEVSSNYVYVKGTNHTPHASKGNYTELEINGGNYIKMIQVSDSTILNEIDPNGARATIGRNNLGYRGQIGSDCDNTTSDVPTADFVTFSNDCYIKNSFSTLTATNTNKLSSAGAYVLGGIVKCKISGANKYGFYGIGVEQDGRLYIGHSSNMQGTYPRTHEMGTKLAAGVSTAFGEWHNYAAEVSETTATADYYFDDVLIAKSMILHSGMDANSFGGAHITSAGLSISSGRSDAAALFYFDNMIAETTATADTVAATPDQPFDIVPEGGEGGEGGDDPVVPAVLVTGSIADGITINRAALADAETTVAVVAVTAAGVPTVQLSTSASEAETTFTVTGAARVFVWNWATLAPFCAPIQ